MVSLDKNIVNIPIELITAYQYIKLKPTNPKQAYREGAKGPPQGTYNVETRVLKDVRMDEQTDEEKSVERV